MARPKKNTAEKRTHQLPPIRCTESEFNTVLRLSQKAGLSITAFMRQALIKQKVQTVDHDWSGVVIHLKKIGININQQTKKLHQFNRVPPELYALWGKLSKLLDDIILNHHHGT